MAHFKRSQKPFKGHCRLCSLRSTNGTRHGRLLTKQEKMAALSEREQVLDGPRERVDTGHKMSFPPQRRRVVAASTSRSRSPAELRAVRVVRDEDTETDASYLKQDGFEDRLSEYKRGRLHFMEMWIEADVVVGEGVEAIVTSSGVSGIESDTTDEELDALIVEDWCELRSALKTMGVSTEQLPLEVDRAWIEWRT